MKYRKGHTNNQLGVAGAKYKKDRIEFRNFLQENDGIEASNKANFGNLDNLNEKHFYGTSEMHLYWNSLSPLLWCPRAENMSLGDLGCFNFS